MGMSCPQRGQKGDCCEDLGFTTAFLVQELNWNLNLPYNDLQGSSKSFSGLLHGILQDSPKMAQILESNLCLKILLLL